MGHNLVARRHLLQDFGACGVSSLRFDAAWDLKFVEQDFAKLLRRADQKFLPREFKNALLRLVDLDFKRLAELL